MIKTTETKQATRRDIPRAHGERVQSAINEYKKRFLNDDKGNGSFFASDLYDINDLSGGRLDAISNALMVGFMIGYRKGKRDARG